MGGLISIYALCEYPDVFGGALCFSTHCTGLRMQNKLIPNSFINYLHDNLPTSGIHKLYFDTGTIGLDELYLEHQVKVDSIIKQKGYSNKDWISKV